MTTPGPSAPPDPPAGASPVATDAAVARATEKIEAVVRLAGGVAHDFNNLLTVISGNTQFLLDELAADDPHRGELSEIAEAARRAATLTYQLLAFSRQLVLHPRLVNLAEVLEGKWSQLLEEVGPGVRLTREVPDSLGPVLVDPQLFGQAILHLVRNAADATAGSGTVVVGLSNVSVDDRFAATHRPMDPGDYVLLSVRDDGTGMDPQTLTRAFEPFFSTKDTLHGTGMGLPSTYGIVKQSGGFIWLDSNPGAGTLVRIFLPLAATSASPVRVRTPVRADREGHETILVVEDEDLVRLLTTRTLRRAGYQVVEAPNAHAALELVRKGGLHPDLLLTDIVMPGMSGRELAVTLVRELPGLDVILLSGFVDKREPLLGFGGGRWIFLPKPFSLDELRSRVREALILERSSA